jgi:hypothetical protein
VGIDHGLEVNSVLRLQTYAPPCIWTVSVKPA